MPSIVAMKSETAVEVGLCHAQSSPQKRRLRSDAAAAAASAQGRSISLSTPMKWKSPRRCFNSSPNSVKQENVKVSSAFFEMAVKDASANLTTKQNWNPRDVKQVSGAKEALHVSTAPSCIVCRETEQQRVFDFCKLCIQEEKPGSLYVCGCPGTGKSLSMEKVRVGLVDWAKEMGFEAPDILAINCTSFTKTSEIFSKIVEKTQPRNKLSGSTTPLQYLQNLYSQQQQPAGSKMMLIIADELDYLITKDRAVLHDLFMLTTFPFSRCIIIGIANAIDLADRFLPRLQSLNCKPLVVTFRAYSKDQILRILQERLMGLPYLVFHPQALELCARKVASASGDMRKALCVCRSAIEILEAELRESTSNVDSLLQQTTDVASESFKLQENDIVRIDHMASALSKAYRSPAVDTIQSLPQHQQIILCSAVKFFRGGKKDTTLAELNKSYIEVCKSTMIPSVGIQEFQSMFRVLNDQGLLKLGPGRDDKVRRVTLKVDEADISFALQGVRFFRTCLQ